MIVDFDRNLDRRNTDCVKWDGLRATFGTDDVLPLWVADMDFASPPEVVAALHARVEHSTFGYALASCRAREAIVGWLERKHRWKVDPDWIVFASGVVPSLAVSVLAYTRPGDEVVVQSPVYPPFFEVVKANGRRLVNSMLLNVGGRYEIDWTDLEAKLRGAGTDEGPRMMILCSPANPVGRVWSRSELERIAELCRLHHVVLVSDEIHADIIYPGHRHTPAGDVTLMAPSKTFNLQGLGTSYAVIPDARLRQAFRTVQSGLGMGQINALGIAAMEAAYTMCDDWHDQLIAYLCANRDYLADRIATSAPGISMVLPEGMYVCWLDCRALGLGPGQLTDFFTYRARVGVNDGRKFGPGGEGFVRLNIACTRSTLVDALNRIEEALTATGLAERQRNEV
ncbi:MAG: Cystathionine beta-lyase PatB [Firmicutes bacterium ADurb.Bin506]|nr:MAG: Cystathionine beta-lyase PatB [Firmicutes bacterium ADurb.Bin506]